MNATRFAIVTNEDDWEGLYVDGRLVHEGHSIPRSVLLDALGVSVETVVVQVDGTLPDTLEEARSASD